MKVSYSKKIFHNNEKLRTKLNSFLGEGKASFIQSLKIFVKVSINYLLLIKGFARNNIYSS